jgi:outer membrane lipoprotein SlyB
MKFRRNSISAEALHLPMVEHSSTGASTGASVGSSTGTSVGPGTGASVGSTLPSGSS